MASILLSGTLLDPNSDLAVGDKIRFTHRTTTGQTIKSAVSVETINPSGTYSIELQYGLIMVEYRDVRTHTYRNLGVVTVNQDSTATSLPELLNAIVPPTDEQLLEFQAILADCVAAADRAESAAVDAENSAAQSANKGQKQEVAIQSPYFGVSNTVIVDGGDNIAGDPYIFNDGSKYKMYFFRNQLTSPFVSTFSVESESLDGPWTNEVEIESLRNFHKFVFLSDTDSKPVMINGKYYGYAAYFISTASKRVHAFSATSLDGPWIDEGIVVPTGGAGSDDDYNTDTPWAVYENGKTYLYYMGANSTPPYAVKGMLTTSTSPTSGFVKQGVVLDTSATDGDWDYGWIGGFQVFRINSGEYYLLYNAGNTKPSSPGQEPDASALGVAYAESLDGPFFRDRKVSPILDITGHPLQSPVGTNVWRGHLAYDPAIGSWYLYFNSGPAGNESILHAKQSFYDFKPDQGANGYNQQLTTTLEHVVNSNVRLNPGSYIVTYSYNLYAGGLGGSNIVNITASIFGAASGGTPVAIDESTVVDFIGQVPYSNVNSRCEAVIVSSSTDRIISLKCGVTEGAALVDTRIRNLRVRCERLK